MNNEKITIADITKRWRLIVATTIIFALITFIVSALLPVKYQSDVSVIVVQEQASEKVDAFSATKSAEFLSNIFTRVIYTTSFFNAVQDAPFDVKRNFSHDAEEREEEWKKLISVKKVNNTGIIHISVFDESRKTAEETAKAIAYILTTKGEEYHGGGERVGVRLIDGPNTPLRPTVPHILSNTIIGALLGFVLAIIVVYFFPDKFCLASRKNRDVETTDFATPVTVVASTSQEQEEIALYDDDKNVDTVDEHFKNAHGTIEFDEEKEEYYDVEVDELHDRISHFSKSARIQEASAPFSTL
ncbi:MAG: Wzz/FepE/Etk N-terminal domain-containing protein [Patescibacteria group bacterium]|nr:Wzz/FepE/Etk N-terminal domain-containing protein [Patescibacteria group bacterium]